MTDLLRDIAPLCDQLTIRSGGAINFCLTAHVRDDALLDYLDAAKECGAIYSGVAESWTKLD